LALAILDLNERVLKLVTFDDGVPLERSSSTLGDVELGCNIEGEERTMIVAMVMNLMILIMRYRREL
jgi:hypothetical protein